MTSHINMLVNSLRKTVDELCISKPLIENLSLNDQLVPCVKLDLPPSFCLYLIPSRLFPAVPPVCIMCWDNEGTKSYFSLDWSIEYSNDIDTRLYQAISKYIAGPPPFKVGWGSSIGSIVSDTYHPSFQTLWKKFLISDAYKTPSILDAFKFRNESDLVDALSISHITIIGLGSVGSYMVEQLVRSGLSSISLIDPDIVEASNLTRTIYTVDDLNQRKVDAIETKLRLINPHVQVRQFAKPLQSIDKDELKTTIENSHLVIAATDDPKAQSLINLCCYHSQIPAVFIGLYRGAKGGEIATIVPSMTPCYQCMTGLRYSVDLNKEKVSRDIDYGTNRLRGEIALNSNIQHVASAGLNVCYSLIATIHKANASIAQLIPQAIAQEKHFLTLGMEPEYWFYPAIFDKTAGQFAFQSVWLTAKKDESCLVCGDNTDRDSVDPYHYIKPSPTRQELKKQLHKLEETNDANT